MLEDWCCVIGRNSGGQPKQFDTNNNKKRDNNMNETSGSIFKEAKRSINIYKKDFDVIKAYCDANAMTVPRFVVKTCLEALKKNDKRK